VSDGDDYADLRSETRPPKEKKQKREKPTKKEKEPKEKPPKKEKEPKEKTPKKKGRRGFKPEAQFVPAEEYVSKAMSEGISTIQRFKEYMEEDSLVSQNQDAQASYLAHFKKKIQPKKTTQPQENDETKGISDEEETSSEGSEESSIEEEVVLAPEDLKLPKNKPEPIKATFARLPRWLAIEDHERPMSINFRDGKANCFIYTTEEGEFLILNGVKIAISHLQDAPLSGLYQQTPVKGFGDVSTEAIMIPTVEYTDQVRFTTSYNLTDFITLKQKQQTKSAAIPTTPLPRAEQKKRETPALTSQFLQDSSD